MQCRLVRQYSHRDGRSIVITPAFTVILHHPKTVQRDLCYESEGYILSCHGCTFWCTGRVSLEQFRFRSVSFLIWVATGTCTCSSTSKPEAVSLLSRCYTYTGRKGAKQTDDNQYQAGHHRIILDFLSCKRKRRLSLFSSSMFWVGILASRRTRMRMCMRTGLAACYRSGGGDGDGSSHHQNDKLELNREHRTSNIKSDYLKLKPQYQYR